MSDVIQGSAQWHEERLGSATASRILDIIPSGKTGKYYKSREDYMYQLLAERLSGVVQTQFVSKAMAFGIEQEPIARAVYEGMTGNTVTEVGYFKHPTIPMCGASPDGTIGDDGLIEIKNPETSTHLKLLASGEIAPRYNYQMQMQLICTGRDYCIYFDYDNRLPVEYQTFIRKVPRSKVVCELIEIELVKFLDELDELESRIRSKSV